MPTIISELTYVRGRIQGQDDLEIDGFVEGEIAIDGDILVGATGRVGSALVANHIVIRGAVRGDVTALLSVALEDGARVLGDVRAPRVSIADGALVRGHVEAGEGASGLKKAPAQTPARASFGAAPAARTAPVVQAAPVVKAVPAPAALVARVAEPAKKVAAAPVVPATKSAPVPVVPVLKKGAKAVAKKSR